MKFQMVAGVGLAVLLVSFTFNGESHAQKATGDSTAVQEKEDPKPFLGAAFRAEEDEREMQVMQVVPLSPADKAGIKVNDIVLEMDGNKHADYRSLIDSISKKKVGDEVAFLIRRNDEEISVSAVLADRSKFSLATQIQPLRSMDGLQVAFDIYAPHPIASTPMILLCHQAGWSRGEYREIAPKLNQMGFNCFAIDQRSGGEVNDVVNKTNKLAVEQGKEVAFLDAEQDIIAALNYVRQPFVNSEQKPKVILWGSSYSAALSLRIAGEHPELVDGVLAFAPGEYFERFGKPGDWIESSAKKIKVPAFITSAKDEQPNWQSIYDAIPGESKMMFVPETAGNHGSRALWEKFDDHESYWEATNKFLAPFAVTEEDMHSHEHGDQDHEEHEHGDHKHDEHGK